MVKTFKTHLSRIWRRGLRLSVTVTCTGMSALPTSASRQFCAHWLTFPHLPCPMSPGLWQSSFYSEPLWGWLFSYYTNGWDHAEPAFCVWIILFNISSPIHGVTHDSVLSLKKYRRIVFHWVHVPRFLYLSTSRGTPNVILLIKCSL